MSALPLFRGGSAVQAKPLRPHQHKAMAQLKSSFLAGNRRTVVQLPTGAGKTRLAAEIVNGALAKGNRVAFTVPAISLVDQTIEAFESEGIESIGVMQASHDRTHYGAPVQICSVQTLGRRFLPEVDLVIVDECHQMHKIIPKWMEECPNVRFVGLSATPWARGMAEYWEDLIVPVRMQELIDEKYLSPFRVFTPSHPDLSGVQTVAGDYHEGQLADVMSEATLVADIVHTWLKRANWQPTLVFAVDRAHAAKLQGEFAAAGVKMGYCDANVDLVERKILFDQMARGDIAGIVNIGTLTTGVDADVRCVVLARPTKSEMLFVQMIGRALRTAPGKTEALILDHADNHARMGFVTEIHHPTLLKGKERNQTRKEKGEPMPKECSSCGTLKPPKVRECPSCGFVPERQSEIEVEDGELVELTKSPRQASMVDKREFYAQVLWVARSRGRSPGWAAHTYRDKFGVWPIGEVKRAAPMPASPEVLSFVKSKDIRFAKSRGKR